MADQSAGSLSNAAWAATLRGGAYPALAAGAVLVTGSAFWGWRAALGAAVGALLTVGAFVVGPLLMRSSAQWSPSAMMLAAVMAYGVSVIVLGLAFVVLARVGWLSQTAVGVAIFGCSSAWLAGHVRTAGRLRVLAFGDLQTVAETAAADRDAAGHGGSAQPPGTTSH